MSSDSDSDEFWAPDGSDTDPAYAKLQAGAVNNNAELIHEAIASGVNINALFPYQDDGTAALHEAASRGNIEALRALIANDAKIDIRAPEASNQFEDRTPLYCAAEQSRPLAVRTLLEAGANPETLGPRDDTPFSAILYSLVQKASVGQRVQVDQQHIETIDAFIEHGVDANDKKNFNGATVMEQAAVIGDRKLIQNLLDHGVSLKGALVAAARFPQGLDTVEYIMGLGLEDSRGEALAAAARNNRLEVARSLLAHQSVETVTGSGALHLAALNGHADMIRLLLDHGLHVDTSNAEGATPLLVACTSGRPLPTILQLLLDRGANVNATFVNPLPKSLHKKGDTPLHTVARYSYPAHVSLLLDAGAELDARNVDGQTPLHSFAAGFNNGWPMFPHGEDPRLEALHLLVEAGADLNATDAGGNTAMLLLSTNVRVGRREKMVQAVELLLEHGATKCGELAGRVEETDGELAERLRRLIK